MVNPTVLVGIVAGYTVGAVVTALAMAKDPAPSSLATTQRRPRTAGACPNPARRTRAVASCHRAVQRLGELTSSHR